MSWQDAIVITALLVWCFLSSPVASKLWQAVEKVEEVHNKGEEFEVDREAFVVPTQIHHARMLPVDSTHQFRYPSLYLAFELHALEDGRLDCGRIFSSAAERKKTVLKLDPHGFGRRVYPNMCEDSAKAISSSILLKLIYELRLRNYLAMGPQDISADSLRTMKHAPWVNEVGQIWAIAMPSIFGMGGFNPLTVYYVYRPGDSVSTRGALWLCVLEVHNTFNERHIYVCETGSNSTPVRQGYQYEWRFPREFHVSPFNDRSGYYHLFLEDLWPVDQHVSPVIDIRLLLMADSKDATQSGTLQKKLMATLTSQRATSMSIKPKRPAKVMTRWNLIWYLVQQPFDLFLPVMRIMWEAMKLHWQKRLPVYIRPEPHGIMPSRSEEFNGIGWPSSHNPVESKLGIDTDSNSKKSSGGIFWNPESALERPCRQSVESFFKLRTRQDPHLSIKVLSTNPESQTFLFSGGTKTSVTTKGLTDDEKTTLVFYTLSNETLFTDLCLYSPSLAFILGSQMDRSWGVNSIDSFHEVFAPFSRESPSSSRRDWLAHRLRRYHLQWSLTTVSDTPRQSTRKKQTDFPSLLEMESEDHPLNAVGHSYTLLICLTVHILLLQITAFISQTLRVLYIRTPWANVGEAVDMLSKGKNVPHKST